MGLQDSVCVNLFHAVVPEIGLMLGTSAEGLVPVNCPPLTAEMLPMRTAVEQAGISVAASQRLDMELHAEPWLAW